MLLTRGHTDFTNQIDPFEIHAAQLARREIHVRKALWDAPLADDVLDFPWTAVLFHYRLSREYPLPWLAGLLANLRELVPGCPIVLLDDHGSPYVPMMRLSNLVDLYVAECLPRDRRWWSTTGSHWERPLEHRLRRILDDPPEDPAPYRAEPEGPLPANFHLGWNIALDRRYYSEYNHPAGWNRPAEDRPNAIHCRIGVDPDMPDILQRHRLRALQACGALAGNHAVISSPERIPHDDYLREMLDSQAVLSPYGWAEVCFRDFEAIACGSLMIKPDMSHLDTAPDIYHDGETCVIVRADFGDLEEKLIHYASRPDERTAIVRNAHERFREFLGDDWFANQVCALLDRLVELRQ